jgi:hypothetical protein
MAIGTSAAFAYRPFVGTDAAVADINEVEIELQPAGSLRQDQQTSLIAPDFVYNYGFAKDWEFVFEGARQLPLGTTDEPAAIVGAGAFLKYVAREGVLQDKPGPSVAFEFGPLLPGLHADQGLVRASIPSSLSAGIGEPFTGISPPRSRATSTRTSSPARSSRDLFNGRSGLSLNSSTRRRSGA